MSDRSTIRYTQMPLDRASGQRKDPAWLAQQQQHPQRRVIPVRQNKNLIALDHNNHVRGETIEGDSAQLLMHSADDAIFLGLENDTPYFAVDLSSWEEDNVAFLTQNGATWTDLRQVGAQMSMDDSAMLAYARGLIYWQTHHRFCGTCGQMNHSHEGGHMRRCGNDACAKETFPRTDPAVIMLAQYTDADGTPYCLLGAHTRFANNVYSTLAGFVDPGESLEEAVIREIKEEAGVTIDDVTYIASQPWPFPASIMLGFHATASDPHICVDNDELRDAQWFSADQVRKFDEWGDEGDGKKIPRKDSIARYLIDRWLEQVS